MPELHAARTNLVNIASIARGAGAIRITGANGDQVTIKGSGFNYDINGFLISRTVTSVIWLNNGANYAVASGFSLNAVLTVCRATALPTNSRAARAMMF